MAFTYAISWSGRSGLSRPQRARVAAMTSGVRLGFLITRSGEPGIIRNIRKFRIMIATIVTNAWASFRAR